jgi:uncharacterized protein YlxW (UPF0749 family)
LEPAGFVFPTGSFRSAGPAHTRRPWASRGALALATFLVGLAVAMQLRAQVQAAAPGRDRPEDRARLLTDVLDANAGLARQVASLQLQLLTYRQTPRQNETDLLVADLNRLKLVNGLIEATGDGIEVRTAAPLSDVDLQDLINELRNSGAEAMALNETRLIARSAVAGGRDSLTLDGVPLATPFVLRAIGSSETLARGLERKGGVLQLLRLTYPNATIELIQRSNLILPVYKGASDFQFGQPVRP